MQYKNTCNTVIVVTNPLMKDRWTDRQTHTCMCTHTNMHIVKLVRGQGGQW